MWCASTRVTLSTSSLGDFWVLRPGREVWKQRGVMEVGTKDNQHCHCRAWQLPQGKKHYSFFVQCRVNPSHWGGKAWTTGGGGAATPEDGVPIPLEIGRLLPLAKKIHQNLEAQYPLDLGRPSWLHHGLPPCPHPNLQDPVPSHSVLHLNRRFPVRVRVQRVLGLNQLLDEVLCFILSSTALWLQEIGFPLGHTHKSSVAPELGIRILEVMLWFHHLSSDIRSNNRCLYVHLFSKNVQKCHMQNHLPRCIL